MFLPVDTDRHINHPEQPTPQTESYFHSTSVYTVQEANLLIGFLMVGCTHWMEYKSILTLKNDTLHTYHPHLRSQLTFATKDVASDRIQGQLIQDFLSRTQTESPREETAQEIHWKTSNFSQDHMSSLDVLKGEIPWHILSVSPEASPSSLLSSDWPCKKSNRDYQSTPIIENNTHS